MNSYVDNLALTDRVAIVELSLIQWCRYWHTWREISNNLDNSEQKEKIYFD